MPANGYRYPKEKMDELLEKQRVLFGTDDSQIIQIKEYLEDYQDKLSSWVVLDSRAGANEIGRLFDDRKIFTNPKPFELLTRLFGFLLDDSDTVMDFFAGSCSSAQAVLEMNAADGKNRRFIMVQLPEKLSSDVKEHRPALKFCKQCKLDPTIAEIAKERIRRVSAKLAKTQSADRQLTLVSEEDNRDPIDLGFRVLKLDKSNFRLWEGRALVDSQADLAKQLELHIDHINEAAEPLDLLYELLLKAGFELTTRYAEEEIAGKHVYSISEGGLLISLDQEISQGLIDAVAEAEPMQFICLDRAFKGNDQLKANAVQTFAARNQGREKAEQIIFRTV